MEFLSEGERFIGIDARRAKAEVVRLGTKLDACYCLTLFRMGGQESPATSISVPNY